MNKCGSCSLATSCSSKNDTSCTVNNTLGGQFVPLAKGSKIWLTLAVGSGKGGVGKSTITALLATMLNRQGYKVGILDADLTGPSMAQAFGIYEPIYGDEQGLFLPARTLTNMDIMSLNLLLPEPDEPVIWRGPVISQVIKQFWGQVQWGELDVLLIDMPPGTGDVPLTLFQEIPIDRFLLVSTPQDLVHLIVRKSIKMAQNMKIPILGLIENMAYFKDEQSQKIYYPFGQGRGEALAQSLNLAYLQGLPIQEKITKAMDKGEIETISGTYLEGCVQKISELIERKKKFFERYTKKTN